MKTITLTKEQVMTIIHVFRDRSENNQYYLDDGCLSVDEKEDYINEENRMDEIYKLLVK